MSTNVEREFIQVQNDLREDYKIRKKTSPILNVWRSRPTKGILFLLCFSIVVPVLIYYFIIDKSIDYSESYDTCVVDKTYRISCGKAENTTFDECTKIHCCFDNSTKRCFHYLPSKYYYFNESSDRHYRRSLDKTPFEQPQLENIQLSVETVDDYTVRIILHEDNSTGDVTCNNTTQYNCVMNSHPLFVEFYRPDWKYPLLTTAKGPMIISQNYWEWSFQLTDEYLFGLGQTLIDLDENSTLTKVIYGNDKDHNTLPNFLAYKNGSYHGLVVRHSGPMEITVLPSKLVSLKSLAGKEIMLELSIGPTIKEVIQQQNKGRNQTFDPDILGVHVCREGSSLNLKEIIEDFKNEDDLNIQCVSDCLHENLLLAAISEDSDSEDSDSYISLINDAVNDRITNYAGRQFALTILPQVPYNSILYNGTKDSIYFQVNQSTDYKGQYLKNDVFYPNFNHPEIGTFIDKLINTTKKIFDPWPKKFTLGRNWPSDQSFMMEETEDFQYLSKELTEAMSFTLPWKVTSDNKSQFLDHNNYGYYHVDNMNKALVEQSPDTDVLIMTASHTFDTVQPILVQNIDISWTNFHKAIITILYNSLFGYPLTSIPVCGSTDSFTESHESLCMRWYLMASTAPLFRISSDKPRRDPSSLKKISEFASAIATKAIDFRYSLLNYMYTVLRKDEPIMRPMFYDFPDDINTFALVDQYMVGNDLLVVHPTLPDQTQIAVYLPKGVDNWFEFWGGDAYGYDSSKDGWISLTITETDWLGFVREGAVVPLVEKSTDEDSTNKNVKLKVALSCKDEICTASGTMVTGFSESFIFTLTKSNLTVTNDNGNDSFLLSEIEIFEANTTPFCIKFNPPPQIVNITTYPISGDLGLTCY